ncbi:hypothetical protein [Butyrivibrio proteoclasticus]|uniref:hypothetical protein n=1 Tax=Butyrivibrio proteoclasticus TaxID=43305 RepID=UPI00047E1DBA|nr:hypothetical protein [Butyrivibrio proteoclasticus]
MKILLVLDNLSSSCGANVGIVYELARTWVERGHEVYCLTRKDRFHDIDQQKAGLLHMVWSFDVTEDDILNNVTKSDKWIHLSATGKAIFELTHPVFLQKMIDKKFCESSEIRNEYRKQIEKLFKERSFDAAVAVTEPFYIADALASAKVDTDKYVIMMDPYTNNPSTTDRTRKKKLAREQHVFESARKVFTLDFVGNDMNYLSEELLGKRVNFCVPKVKKCGAGRSDDGATVVDSEKIDFVYVGQLYEDIRNPELMLKIFTRLPDNYILHFYGGGCEQIVDKYKEILGDRLVIHGWVSSDESALAQQNAHILINMNNSIKNMLPSKLIEYINTGKPILNICQIQDCPSIPYIQKYPMAVNIMPMDNDNNIVTAMISDRDLETMAMEVQAFTENYQGKIVEHDVIENIYSDCISENVADMMLEEMQK